MPDPREDFLSRIDVAETRVRPFGGFLFLCGGPQDIEAPTPLQSVRHLLYNELVSGRHTDLAQKLKLAEDVQDWFRDGTYKDLVTFEEHLASLSSVVFLIVESPGAIAELGAFSVTPAISERLIALVAEHHYEAESFIRLGPLRRLSVDTGREALVYDWHDRDSLGRVTENFEKIAGDVSEILTEVRQLLRADAGEKMFKAAVPSHVMLLICELCDLFGALNESEIKDYIEIATGVTRNTTEQYLFLLDKCGILNIKARGHGRYYYPADWSSHITFGYKPGPAVERDRVRIDVVEYYKRDLKSRAEVVRLLQKAAA